MTTSNQTFIVFTYLALLSFANGITRLPCKTHGDFSIILDDIKDAGPVGKTVTSETRRACVLECLAWPSCMSLNFKKETNSCDLLERNLTESGVHLTQDMVSVYMTTEEDQMNVRPIFFTKFFIYIQSTHLV